VAGAARVQRADESLSALARMTDGDSRLERCGENLYDEVHALRSWYVTLGDTVVHASAVPRPHIPDAAGRRRLLACVREAAVGGAARVRGAAESLSALARMTDGDSRLARCGENLDDEVHALRSWYVTLGDSVVHASAVPRPHIPDAAGRRRLLACVREAAVGGDETKLRPALVLLWTSQHLDNLWRLESHLGRHASETS